MISKCGHEAAIWENNDISNSPDENRPKGTLKIVFQEKVLYRVIVQTKFYPQT